MPTSLSTLCHSKTLAPMCGVLSMKSRRWWHPLGGGVNYIVDYVQLACVVGVRVVQVWAELGVVAEGLVAC